MSSKEGKYSQYGQGRHFLFVHQDAKSYRAANPRAVAGHARRRQTDLKRWDRQASAQQQAAYARSLVGWVSLKPPRLPAEAPQRAMTMLIQPTAGLRVDPFNSLPVENTIDVMQTIDYFIHVWSQQRTAHFDDFVSCNTYPSLCWPIALQDEMLFEAAVAVSRAAWCLAQRRLPNDDYFVLVHRGKAMSKLRQRLLSAGGEMTPPDERITLTIYYMLNIAYMANEHSAINIHWTAFKSAAGAFVAARPTDNVASVVLHRLNSWKILDDYRKGVYPIRGNLPLDPFLQPRRFTYSFSSLTWRQQQILSIAPRGFVEMFYMDIICVEIIEIVVQLSLVLTTISQDHIRRHITYITRQLEDILLSEHLLNIESQVCYCLIALSLYIHHSLDQLVHEQHSVDMSRLITEQNSAIRGRLQILDKVAQSFINKKLTPLSYSIDLKRRCLIWCSVAISSVIFSLIRGVSPSSEDRLRGKAHVILISMTQHLLSDYSNQTQTEPPPLNTGDITDYKLGNLSPEFPSWNFLCTGRLRF